MIFCGADLSLKRSALVFIDENGDYVRTSTFGKAEEKKLKSVPEGEFLKLFWNWVCSQIEGESDGVMIALEHYAMTQKDNVGAHRLHELGGIFKCAAAFSGVIIVLVYPGTLKKFVTGGGHADKLKVFKRIVLEFNENVETDDEADATGLAVFMYMAWCRFCGMSTGEPKFRIDVVDKYLKENGALFKDIAAWRKKNAY